MEKHISVLLEESISALNLKEDSIIVDCTLGYGGHSSYILQRIKRGVLFAFDQDSEAIRHSTNRLNAIGTNFTIIKSKFVNLKEELTRIFKKYGEDKFSNNIAKKIVEYRKQKPIETTLELVEIIKSAVPMKFRKDKHPARQIFQAIRIEVNHELDVLEPALEQALSLIKVGGRVAVITFHSLEDRIVKQVFKEKCKIDDKVRGLPNIPDEYLPDFKLVVNKAILPSEEELKNNNRARSAKLRVIERIK